jgi:hypothetical protein
MEEKRWFQSKIFWTSIIALITGISGVLTGEVTVTDVLVTCVGAVMAIFRLFFTKTNLTT